MSATNKAVLIKAFDSAVPLSTISVEETPIPEPGEVRASSLPACKRVQGTSLAACSPPDQRRFCLLGEVLVRINLRPVDPADYYASSGVYPGLQPKQFPVVLGADGVGTVAANGPGASRFAVGQRVVGAPFPYGTWQQYLVTSQDRLIAVPDGVSDEAACQFYVNPMTVAGMLDVLAVPQGEWLLQTAAASALGRQLIQVAKRRGIRTINVVRRPEPAAELEALGADAVVVSAEGEGLAERAKELTGGKGAYGAVDAVGGQLLGQVVASLRDGGTVLCYGLLSGLTASFNVLDVLFRGIVVRGFWLRPWLMSKDEAERRRVAEEVMGWLKGGLVEVTAGPRLPLEGAVEALAETAAGSSSRNGKLMLEG